MDRIVVGVDGTDESLRALAWALEEGWLRDAEVEVVHAYFPHLSEIAVLSGGQGLDVEAEELLRQAVEPALATRPGARVWTEAVPGRPAPVLVGAAAGARLLVVGSRGGPAGRRRGSVSRRCLRHAPCPVVVVH